MTTLPPQLEKVRDELVEDYDMNFEFTGSYSSLDMDSAYKTGFNACYETMVKDVESALKTLILIEFCTGETFNGQQEIKKLKQKYEVSDEET